MLEPVSPPMMVDLSGFWSELDRMVMEEAVEGAGSTKQRKRLQAAATEESGAPGSWMRVSWMSSSFSLFLGRSNACSYAGWG
jgi:predicted Rossmann-fold nucleotide-binding protein